MSEWEPVVSPSDGWWVPGARNTATGRTLALTHAFSNAPYRCMTRWGARREARRLVKRLTRTRIPELGEWESA